MTETMTNEIMIFVRREKVENCLWIVLPKIARTKKAMTNKIGEKEFGIGIRKLAEPRLTSIKNDPIPKMILVVIGATSCFGGNILDTEIRVNRMIIKKVIAPNP